MRHFEYILALLTLSLFVYCADAQQVRVFPGVSAETRYLRSTVVGEEFEISVALPLFYRPDTAYPVLYITDANVAFAMSAQIASFLQIGKELPQIILVGIGYRTDSAAAFFGLRSRDLTPTPIPDPTKNKWKTGGAPLFLRFLKEELMPFISKNYRTSSDAGYMGYSYGGLFGLYALLHEPETFQRYIIGSPSIWYDSLVTLRDEEQYASAHSDLPARVYMSVGEREEKPGDKSKMVSNMKLLADRLLNRHYPNLRLETAVFEGESHTSGTAIAVSRGLRAIYKK